jgi:copper(I)-binding protein
MNYRYLTALFLIIFSILQTAHADGSKLEIENAWIAEAPPVSKVMAAYMTIKNTGPETIDIISAESDLYSSIEFHETIQKDGMARMARHESLTIPANDTLTLKRGGTHLMLFNPVKTLVEGDSVTIKLTTENKVVKTISVTVKKARY